MPGLSLARRARPVRLGFDPAEPMLLPQRASTIYPLQPNGADIRMVCTTREGGTYYCKEDRDGRRVCAAEMFSTRLAGIVGIPTPFCSIVETEDGDLLFGSLASSVASEFEVQDFLTRPLTDELGARLPLLGHYLSGLYAFDLCLGNDDRSLRNFLIQDDSRRLCAFDFANANLSNLSSQRFPVEQGATISVGRRLRRIHGFDEAAAMDMVDKLQAVRVEQVEAILREMPGEWWSSDEGKNLCAVWDNQRGDRLDALRSGLRDGSLL